jgi:excinuclease ABC subunit A
MSVFCIFGQKRFYAPQPASVTSVESNKDVIKSADRVIDPGPEAGDDCGNLVFAGNPADLKKCKESYTGRFF